MDGVRWEWPAVVMEEWRAGLLAWVRFGLSDDGVGQNRPAEPCGTRPGHCGRAVEESAVVEPDSGIPGVWCGHLGWGASRRVVEWYSRMKTMGEKKCCVGWEMWYGVGQLQERA